MRYSIKKIFAYFTILLLANSHYEIQTLLDDVRELQLFLYECIGLMYFYNLDAHFNSILRKNVTIATIHRKKKLEERNSRKCIIFKA